MMLRKEFFGGLLFLPDEGEYYPFNKTAFYILKSIAEEKNDRETMEELSKYYKRSFPLLRKKKEKSLLL